MPRAQQLPGAVAFSGGLESIVKNSAPLAARVSALAQEVQFTVASKTVSGEPIQDQIGYLSNDNLDRYKPRQDSQDTAIARLENEGCRLIRRGRFATTMSGPAKAVETIIGSKLVVQARARRSPLPATQMYAGSFERPFARDLFLTPPTSLSVPTNVSEAVDHLVFIPPPLFFAPNINQPVVNFHHVDEARIRKVLNVPDGADGRDVKIALVDTGFFPHPYYAARNLNLIPTATRSAPHPEVDNYGHGTAIAYNIFAVAPKATVLGYQQTEQPQDALEDADDAGVDVISCSWGWDREQLLPVVQATLLDILRNGKALLFAAGNGHYAWPGSEPDVISVGGVYWNPAGGLEASDYASGYMSGMYPNRRVPDISGLCGQRPKAVYIMMPTQPGNTMDRENGAAAFPQGDGAGPSDGWVGASDTSSATPQLAGIVALMIQAARAKGRTLSPAEIKQILITSCRPVTAGRNAMGFPATTAPNTAVGHGLIDAAAALAQV
jgi:serine protease AprX